MRILFYISALFILVAATAQSGVGISLKNDANSRTVAQITADADGSFTLSNIPDGKYKMELLVGTKRFTIDADCDNDGVIDLAISSTADPSAKSSAVSPSASQTVRLLLAEKGQKKALTSSEWMQRSSARGGWQSAMFEIACELTISRNSIKGKVRCSDGVCQ